MDVRARFTLEHSPVRNSSSNVTGSGSNSAIAGPNQSKQSVHSFSEPESFFNELKRIPRIARGSHISASPLTFSATKLDELQRTI